MFAEATGLYVMSGNSETSPSDVWTVRLDSDANAASFANSVEQAGGDFVALASGPEVHVLATADPTLLPAWQSDLEGACP